MSAFNSSAIAASYLSACEIERSHIFVEGSTLAGLDGAGNMISEKREEKRQYNSHVSTHLSALSPFLHREWGTFFDYSWCRFGIGRIERRRRGGRTFIERMLRHVTSAT
jgi:hypothetical protein